MAMINPNEIAAKLVIRAVEKISAKTSGFAQEQLDTLRSYFRSGLQGALADSLDRASRVKTLFSPEISRDTSSIYVNMHLLDPHRNRIRDEDLINSLPSFRNIVVTGTAGSGKSMFLRFVMIALAQQIKLQFIPILIELRDVNKTSDGFFHFILDQFRLKESGLTEVYFVKLLARGAFCFLFDGFDELDFSRDPDIDNEIFRFCRQYDSNLFVFTSRPENRLFSWHNFTAFKMQPFSKQAALLFLKKIEFDEEVKALFVRDFDQIFAEHESFASNPLLLSLMLLTFNSIANIPGRIHVFYARAYDTLWERHDALKRGFSRKRQSDLDYVEFKKILAAFCYLSYSERVLRFTYQSLQSFLAAASELEQIELSTDQFINDLTQSVCLLQQDGFDYEFIHRSFQEYLSALFIMDNWQEGIDDLIDPIIEFINTDAVFTLMFDTNQSTLERLFLAPRIDNIRATVDEYGRTKDLGPVLSLVFTTVRVPSKLQHPTFIFSSEKGERDSKVNRFILNAYAPVEQDLCDDSEVIRDIAKGKYRVADRRISRACKELIKTGASDPPVTATLHGEYLDWIRSCVEIERLVSQLDKLGVAIPDIIGRRSVRDRLDRALRRVRAKRPAK